MSTDENSPWLGLASFTEETRGFFFGREEEVAELERRVQRKLLTILFGKSGLGKTSILQAGLVPGLRARGYFPVYLRIDYGRDSPEPAEQIKQAINRAAGGMAVSGEATSATLALDPNESIWEFLHHRDDVLKDAAGSTLIPLLIFDQFEELFTLAQSDEFGRTRAARFIEELADLVENRPPKSLEAKLEADESAAERFDFTRSDYRIVIALREDYLAPLESLKKQMPSLSQNRLRLAPMTGNQALLAVLRPGRHLVSQEVAEAIVRFVAGGSELQNAEVEPSLLSLICRELNEQRISQQRTEISLDLLAGSHESILTSFYERALADQPPAVRQLLEDELLTESGYRENLAEERLLRRLQASGAAPDALVVLVNRRLLRIEERLDVRRVELTHDVLTGVVKASRDQRRERETREATERLLAEQAAREHVARRALRRARAIAAGCTLLAAVAVGAAALAFVNVQRARRAEADARQTRAISEQARGQAEGLLGFLTDDFVRELETFGRYQTIAELSQREIDYFHALPQQLQDPQTVRNGASALANQAQASIYAGQTTAGIQSATAAIAVLEPLWRAGDRSESTAVALARAYLWLGANRSNQASPEQYTDLQHAADLLRPIAAQPGASFETRRLYVEILTSVGLAATTANRNEDTVRAEHEAQRVALELGARRRGDVILDGDYASAGAWLATGLGNLGRDAEARRVGEDALGVADQVLAQRPQYGAVLLAKCEIEGALSGAAADDLNPVDAARFATQEEQSSLALVALEPTNALYVTLLGNAEGQIGGTMWLTGRLREGIASSLKAIDSFARPNSGATFYLTNVYDTTRGTAISQAQIGDAAGAAATLAAGDAYIKNVHLPPGLPASWVDALRASVKAELAYERDDFDAARRITDDARVRWLLVRPIGPFENEMKNYALYRLADVESHAEYSLGHNVAAVELQRTAVQAATAVVGVATGPRDVTQATTWLSIALAASGKQDEAARLIGPVVTQYRALAKRNHGDQWLPLELATALYAQSLSDPQHRPALLREAAQLVAHLTPSIAALHDTQAWRARIAKAQR
jgi:hypothetical protein